MARPLTPRQAAFIWEYLKDFNASAAAERAGYSPRTAGQQGHRLLKNVEIQKQLAAYQAEAKSDAVMNLRKLQEWWTDAVLGKHAEFGAEYREQLKASEYLARSQSGFVDRVENEHKFDGVIGIRVNLPKGEDEPA